MTNPTIEEVGHYRPAVGKCPICREWWGLHSIEEENDHGMKILDWLEKKEIAQKISENAALSDWEALMLNPKTVRELREYFKNSHAPARDGTSSIGLLNLAFSLGKINGVFTAKELREYFKNIPPIKGTLGAKSYLALTKEQRRELQKERKERNDQQAFESAEKFLRDMKRKYGK